MRASRRTRWGLIALAIALSVLLVNSEIRYFQTLGLSQPGSHAFPAGTTGSVIAVVSMLLYGAMVERRKARGLDTTRTRGRRLAQYLLVLMGVGLIVIVVTIVLWLTVTP
jgi:hypothetical protein